MAAPVVSRQSGQAAVEAALTLPLVVFLIMGNLQLFLLLQAKLLAQYALFQAARVGSTTNGRCDAMVHAALLSFTPAVRSFMNPNIAGTPGVKLGTVFNEIRNNTFATTYQGMGAESIVWIIREHPRFPGDPWQPAQRDFDLPLNGGPPVRLELRGIFWTPLKVPGIAWMFSRMALAELGIQNYNAVDPLMPTQRNANWHTYSGFTLQSPIASELASRIMAKHYVYPIDVNYTMRMMSPVKLSDFASPNCPPTPSSL
jgi:hypothetical protein